MYACIHECRHVFLLSCMHGACTHPLFLLAESLAASPDTVKYASTQLYCLTKDSTDNIWHTVHFLSESCHRKMVLWQRRPWTDCASAKSCYVQSAYSDQGIYCLRTTNGSFRYLSRVDGSIGCASDWWSGGLVFEPRRLRQHSFVVTDYEIFSTALRHFSPSATSRRNSFWRTNMHKYCLTT